MTIPFDGAQLDQLFEFIAKGLAWYHWGVLIGPDDAVWAGTLTRPGVELFDRLFALSANVRVTEAPGAGTFSYEGAQSNENPHMTIWRFEVYGGVTVSGPDAPEPQIAWVGAVTGSQETMAKVLAVAEGKPAA